MLNKLLPIVIIIAGVFLTGLWLITDNASLNADLSATEQRALRAEGVVRTLQDNMAAQERARRALDDSLRALRDTTALRQKTIEELLNENAQLKDWANRPVPDAIAERLQRSASAGVSDYQQQLPRRNALHPNPDKPPD